MKLIESIMYGFVLVGVGYVLFSFTPFLFSIVFWPQYLAEQNGQTPWQTWPVVLELIVPALGWALIILLLSALVKRMREILR
jgi:predicted membrane-bound mannosyltransferase